MLKLLVCALLLTYIAIAATEATRELTDSVGQEDEDIEERNERYTNYVCTVHSAVVIDF